MERFLVMLLFLFLFYVSQLLLTVQKYCHFHILAPCTIVSNPPEPMKRKQTKTERLCAWASKPPLSAITRRETDTNCTLEAYNGLLLS